VSTSLLTTAPGEQIMNERELGGRMPEMKVARTGATHLLMYRVFPHAPHAPGGRPRKKGSMHIYVPTQVAHFVSRSRSSHCQDPSVKRNI
jgi:hypothetical protein